MWRRRRLVGSATASFDGHTIGDLYDYSDGNQFKCLLGSSEHARHFDCEVRMGGI